MTIHLSPGSRHAIPIRRPNFPFEAPPEGPIPRHWVAGNALATHVFNAMNLTFPEGERFFIRSVNDHLDAVRDPELRAQVRGFVGQEAMHGLEHERYFDVLRAQGYEIDRFLDRFRRIGRLLDRLPASVRIAITAGAEHYTAAFGHFAFQDPLLREAHPTMRRLIYWHATEEVEHKAVAFDVMQAAGVSYFVRILGFAIATILLFGLTATGTRMLLRQDGLDRRAVARLHRQLEARGDRTIRQRMRRRVLDYLRRDFHPNEIDDLAVAHERLREIGLATAS